MLSTSEIQTLIDNTFAQGVSPLIQVTDFASLPAPATATGEFRYVLNETGSYLTFNKRLRGWYQSDGVSWNYAGNNSRLAVDTAYDNSGSGLTAINVQAAIDEIVGAGVGVTQVNGDVGPVVTLDYADISAFDAATDIIGSELETLSDGSNADALHVHSAASGVTGLATVATSGDHVDLLNIGTNTHAQIDSHIADLTIHFTEASIDHTVIQNIGTNSHAAIDSHIADTSIHFTEGSIDHTAIQNIGTNTHAQIDSHIASTANPHSVTFTQAVTADAGTDITAAEAETLSDGSNADALHVHTSSAITDFATAVPPLAPVQSVNTQTGVVVLDTDDIAEGVTNLYYTDGRVAAAPAVVTNTANNTGTVTIHSDVSDAGSGQIITAAERTSYNNRLSFYEVYEAGTTTSAGTFTLVDIDTERAANADFSLAASQVTVNFTGSVKITYTGTAEKITNNTRATSQWAIFQNAVQVVASDSYGYQRNIANGEMSCGRTIVLSVTNGDTIDLRYQVIAGPVATSPTVANGSGIVFERIS